MHPYIPRTKCEIDAMLETIGVPDIGTLFEDIPEDIRLDHALDLPERYSEKKIMEKVIGIAKENVDIDAMTSFVGGGLYHHEIPSVVPYILSRSEFSTAYTPYQPEISQGTLQAIFEYQTMMTQLTGLPVANASHYDGATALAEAAFMACAQTRRNKVLVADTLNPEYLSVLETYLTYRDLTYKLVPSDEGQVKVNTVQSMLDVETAAYIVGTPNYYGIIEDLQGYAAMLHENKSLLIMSTEPFSMMLYKTPGDLGADIAVGEGQGLGNPISFGGPGLGYMTCSEKLMRKMPGRIVGETVDIEGKRGYVLTLQAREQHIRREKATSNITSNQALNALAASIYMSVMGAEGMLEVARRSMGNAHYLADRLCEIDGIDKVYHHSYFNEFIIRVKDSRLFIREMAKKQVIAGIVLDSNTLLVASTECHNKKDLDDYVTSAREVMS